MIARWKRIIANLKALCHEKQGEEPVRSLYTPHDIEQSCGHIIPLGQMVYFGDNGMILCRRCALGDDD